MRAALLLILLTTPPSGAVEEQRPSLEETLERARLRREGELARLSPAVEELVPRLAPRGVGAQETRRLSSARADLVALGPDVTPLLVEHLDPGGDAAEDALARARQVARVLQRLPLDAVTDRLLALLVEGSEPGRANAALVLGTSREPERVVPFLLDVYGESESSLRHACLGSLTRVGGPRADALVVGVLRGGEPAEIEQVLAVLAGPSDGRGADLLLQHLRQPEAAQGHVQSILAVARAHPQWIAEEEARALIDLASSARLTKEDRLALLLALTDLPIELSSRLRRVLDPLSENGDRDLAEAALIALTLTGDTGARRRLLRSLDQLVESNEDWAPYYLRRANALYRIRRYDDAIRDYRRALSAPRKGTLHHDVIYVGLARAYARNRRAKDASEWLDRLPRETVQGLRDDPAFAELRTSPRYADLFGPPDDEGTR